jgi:hypothetical protein
MTFNTSPVRGGGPRSGGGGVRASGKARRDGAHYKQPLRQPCGLPPPRTGEVLNLRAFAPSREAKPHHPRATGLSDGLTQRREAAKRVGRNGGVEVMDLEHHLSIR